MKLVRSDGSTYNYTPTNEPLTPLQHVRFEKRASPSRPLTSWWTRCALRSRLPIR